MTHKSPIRHRVQTHKRKDRIVQSFLRGKNVHSIKLSNPSIRTKSKPHAMYRIYFNSKFSMKSAIRNLYEKFPNIEVSITDMDQLQWIDVYGSEGKNFIFKTYKHSITSIDKISLTKPKVDRPTWAKGMHKEGWWWVDRKGKKWTISYDGSKTEVNLNKEYV